MANLGYLPSRDELREITGAARNLYRVVRRWQRYAHLPGFPVDRGNISALRALLSLERSLNPRALPWGSSSREIAVRIWDSGIADGIVWLRRLADIIIEHNHLQSIAQSNNFESWAASYGPLPPTISVAEDEITALRTAISWLPRFEYAPPPLPRAHAPVKDPAPSPRPAAEPRPVGDILPVLLNGPRVSPVVMGRVKDKLTLSQYRVIQALVIAGDSGLSKAKLQNVTGDAVNVLKRLAKSDTDWGTVIHLPGRAGRGYRVAMPAG